MYEGKIRKVAEALRDRMDPVLIDGALEYLEHNEAKLGFEILCDLICEHDIPLRDAEYLDLVALASDCRLDLHGARFSYLEQLRASRA